ncbi:DUF3397 domain-containing protein [Gracilibacillus alcaliphilus]|uniref:DUF3397 domain-containing protein n=1 Tax=Gracilibacillus alcaliphilus TaxID=1401441 RepID=UPI00195D7C59|nr:DUF3397 domain-containing protein [Gracilibacillus alcaliphilus]MBM7678632.1 hypothetical protein [Gracilibacillus alcaliphilus]
MVQGIYYLLALMVTLPLLVTYVVYVLALKISRQKRYAFHFAIDSTTILYIAAVVANVKWIFSLNLFGYIIAFLLILWLIMVVFHWRTYTDIVFAHVWKRFWKLTFLLFFALYIISSVIGIVYSITSVFIIAGIF